MTQFAKVKGTGIRRAFRADAKGKRLELLAIVGQVWELLAHNIITADNTAGNENKWLVISWQKPRTIREFDTWDEARTAVLASSETKQIR